MAEEITGLKFYLHIHNCIWTANFAAYLVKRILWPLTFLRLTVSFRY